MLRILTASAVISCVCAVQRAHLGDLLTDAEQHDLFMADLKTVLTRGGLTGLSGTAAHNSTLASVSGLDNLSSLPGVSATEAPADPVQHVVAKLRQVTSTKDWASFKDDWSGYMEAKGLDSVNFETYIGWHWDVLARVGYPAQAIVQPIWFITYTICVRESCGEDNARTQLCYTPTMSEKLGIVPFNGDELMWPMSYMLSVWSDLMKTDESVFTGAFWTKVFKALQGSYSMTGYIYAGNFNSKQGAWGGPRQQTSTKLGLGSMDLEVRTPDRTNPAGPRTVYGYVRSAFGEIPATLGLWWNYNTTTNQMSATSMDVELREGKPVSEPRFRARVQREQYAQSVCTRFLSRSELAATAEAAATN